MRRVALLAVLGVSMGLAGCEGSAAGNCSTTDEIGAKLTALTDDLEKARAFGKIDAAAAGEIATQIVQAGTKYSTGDRRAFCAAMDKIRKDAGL